MARKAAEDIEALDLEDEDFDVEEDAAPKKGKGRAKKESEPKGISARQIAEFLDVDPKTFRAWLRRKTSSGEIEVGDHDAKQRYDFGADMNAPLVKTIIAAWKAEPHERGAGLEKANAARAAKKAEAEKPKAKAKK